MPAGRFEWAAHLSYLIWIETPRDERLRRGVERDGIAALDEWESWMAGEDAHYERDPTRERADVVIDGTQPVERYRTDRPASPRDTNLAALCSPAVPLRCGITGASSALLARIGRVV